MTAAVTDATILTSGTTTEIAIMAGATTEDTTTTPTTTTVPPDTGLGTDTNTDDSYTYCHLLLKMYYIPNVFTYYKNKTISFSKEYILNYYGLIYILTT